MTESPCCHCFNQAVLMVHIMDERLQAVIAVILQYLGQKQQFKCQTYFWIYEAALTR